MTAQVNVCEFDAVYMPEKYSSYLCIMFGDDCMFITLFTSSSYWENGDDMVTAAHFLICVTITSCLLSSLPFFCIWRSLTYNTIQYNKYNTICSCLIVVLYSIICSEVSPVFLELSHIQYNTIQYMFLSHRSLVLHHWFRGFISSARRQKDLTGYCFNYVDRPFASKLMICLFANSS